MVWNLKLLILTWKTPINESDYFLSEREHRRYLFNDTAFGHPNFEVHIEKGRSKDRRSVLDEIVNLLRRVLLYCICVLSCGCTSVPPAHNNSLSEYGTELLDTEKLAVENLLLYLETEATPVLTREHMEALSVLTNSDNPDLQASAALCFLEFSERNYKSVNAVMGRLLTQLLRSGDSTVKKVTCQALSNFTLSSQGNNRDVLVSSQIVGPLVHLLKSADYEVECNACGCIASLATHDGCMDQLVAEDGVAILIGHLTSPDLRIQRNAVGAVLNLTHLQAQHEELVRCGVLAVLAGLLDTTDKQIMYYATAALGNIAVTDQHRAMMVAVGNNDILVRLIQLLSSRRLKIKCQVCIALRNLASDGDCQRCLVDQGVLGPLNKLLRASLDSSAHTQTPVMLGAATGCIRNLSMLQTNELEIVSEDFLPVLCRVLERSELAEAQRHAAGTIRNIAVGSHLQAVLDSDCLDSLCLCLLDLKTELYVLGDVTAAIAVLADEDEVKHKLFSLWKGKVYGRLVCLASLSNSMEVQYNSVGILGQLALTGIPESLKEKHKAGIVLYTDKCLKSQDTNFVHIGLWTLQQLLKDDDFVEAFKEHHIDRIIAGLLTDSHSSIVQLAESIQDYLDETEDDNDDKEEEERAWSSA